MVSEETSSQTDPPPDEAGKPTTLIRFLPILAVVSVVLGLAGGLTVLVRSDSWLWAVISIAGSCFLASVLLVLAWLCRRAHQQAQAEQEIISAVEHLAGELRSVRHIDRGAGEVSDTSSADRFEAILAQLHELNDNLMMTDAQRRRKAQDLVERRAGRLKQQAEDALSAGDFVEAEKALENLLHLEPDSLEIPVLRERVVQARSEVEVGDTAEAGKQVENLMATSDFAGAQTVVEALLAKHPDSSRVADLLARVRREREAFVSEQRLEMYRKIEKEASARHWHSALEAARKFLDAYPDGAEADAVRMQLSTIIDNARIEEVRRIRDHIRDLITRRRFGEAVELAGDVIKRFPETAAATELRGQMSRLQERAKSELDNK